MPKLSLNIYSLEHFIQELQGRKGPSIKTANIKQLNLFFLHHLQYYYSSYLKNTFSLQRLVLLLVIYIGNVLWVLFPSEVPPNGFSFFQGHYCQIPHLTHVTGLLLNFLGRNKYMGKVTNNTSGTSAAALRFFLALLSLQLFQNSVHPS